MAFHAVSATEYSLVLAGKYYRRWNLSLEQLPIANAGGETSSDQLLWKDVTMMGFIPNTRLFHETRVWHYTTDTDHAMGTDSSGRQTSACVI